jgi:hypothetical protein
MMLRFVGQAYGPDAIHEAWDEFTLWESDEPDFDPDTPHLQVVLPWFDHHWAPDLADTSIEDPSLHGRSPTSVLLERRGGRLDAALRRYIERSGPRMNPPLGESVFARMRARLGLGQTSRREG